jgi:Glycosyl hydrolases family 39
MRTVAENSRSKFTPKRKGRVLLVAICILSFCLLLRAEPTHELRCTSDAIPQSYFSLNILFHPLTKVPWPSVPFGGWRLAHVNWADLQPERDHWYFDLLDKYALWGDAHHTEILMPLTFSPRWASATPDAETDSIPGLSGPPRDVEDWRTFVRTVATRYKGRIHTFEIWNEPNRKKSWTGSVDELVVLTREASKILKEVDPNNLVVSPPATSPAGLDYLEQFLRKGGGEYVDVIGYHFYTAHTDGPEAMVGMILQARRIMQQNGVGEKPLWDTEAGWLGNESFSSQKAAGFVSRAFILNWGAGAQRFYWYAWEDHHGTQIELVEKDNRTLTSAGQAFATTQEWIKGKVMTHCLTSANNNWICELRNNGVAEYLVWNTDGTRSFEISRDWHVQRYTTLQGQTSPISGDAVPIDIEPIFIQ